MGTAVLYRSAIKRKYWEAGRTSPTQHIIVDAVMKGLFRIRGRKCRRVKALRVEEVEQMLAVCDQTAQHPAHKRISLRDAAILALGFAGALRRSELCGLTIDDLQFIPSENEAPPHKLFVHIRQSKTDQVGKGQRVAIVEGKRVRPIKRLLMWLEASEIHQGYLFQTMNRGGTMRGSPLHHSDIPRLVKQYAHAIGLDPTEIAGHSLRAGFVTSAVGHHARLDKIMEVTRHTNPATVMTYIREADAFREHAGEKFL